ncbi:MAG: hypothetical protein ABL859_11930 [Methylotenera sp.]
MFGSTENAVSSKNDSHPLNLDNSVYLSSESDSNREFLPSEVGRQNQSNSGSKIKLACPLHALPNIEKYKLHKNKCISLFESFESILKIQLAFNLQ